MPLILIALVLSLIGSIEIYHGQVDNIFKEISVIAISVIKLFSFFPTAGLLDQKPLSYEIAIWLAPISLAVGIFSVFTPIYKYFRQFFIHLNKDHIILMGNIEDSLIFARNQANSKADTKIIYLADFTDDINEDLLTNLDIKIVRIDLINPSQVTNQMIMKDEKINTYTKIINFDSDLIGFGRAMAYEKLIKDFNTPVTFFQRIESIRLKEIMGSFLESNQLMDVHYFDTNTLLVNHLIENKKFAYNIPKAFENDFKNKDLTSIEKIGESLTRVSVLILGFNDIAESLLMQISNTGVINPDENIRLVIIDKNASEKFNNYKSNIREFDKVFSYKIIDLAIDSKKALEEIKQDNNLENFTSIFICDKDLSTNIRAVDNILNIVEDIPIAIFDTDKNRMKIFLKAIENRSSKVAYFGDKSEVLTKENIIDERSLEKAKNFNDYYDKVTSKMLSYPNSKLSKEEKWMKLTTIKKESSINQTMHARVKRAILEKFVESLKDYETTNELLIAWESLLDNKTITEQVDIIEKNPLLNYMSALEHKRWNNFYYMRDFIYSDIKNKSKKTHDCLIEPWDEFLKSKQRDKAIYDFLSSLSLEEKIEENN